MSEWKHKTSCPISSNGPCNCDGPYIVDKDGTLRTDYKSSNPSKKESCPWGSDISDPYQYYDAFQDYYDDWKAWVGNVLSRDCIGERMYIQHTTVGDCTCILCKQCFCNSCEVARWWDNVSPAIETALFTAFEAAVGNPDKGLKTPTKDGST